jgi:hypothetical protein
MIIIGVDYHPSDQYIALVDTETGEYVERAGGQPFHATQTNAFEFPGAALSPQARVRV